MEIGRITRIYAMRNPRKLARLDEPAELARIHGPVGLSIGALSPAEIAISILAQVTAVRRAA